MKIPRMSILTLGVSDLKRSTAFYSKVLDVEPDTSNGGVSFFRMNGVWVSLFPLKDLAADISPTVPATRAAFSGMTIAHNTTSEKNVTSIINRARKAGARIEKEPQKTFWGGFAGYFSDPDGFHWEVAYGPMFGFKKDGTLMIRTPKKGRA